MGEVIRWLTHDAQKDLFNFLFALVLNCLFLVLLALLLWPLEQLMLALRLAQGYGSFWLLMIVTTTLVGWLQKIFRVNLYDKANSYVISNLAISCLFQAGWSAFGVLTLDATMPSMASWMTMLSYLVVLVSCFVAFLVVSAFYPGQIYSLVTLPLAFLSFLIFSLWPAMARVCYGWFFALF